MRLPLPSVFDDRNAVDFANALGKCLNVPLVELDFSTVNWVYPFGTLIVAHAIQRFVERRRAASLRTTAVGLDGYGAVSYLGHFGFFQYIGLKTGLAVAEAPGGSRYLPITLLHRESLKPTEPGQVLQDNVDRNCIRLARVIFSKEEERSAADMLSYCFRELVRNSFEHARVSACSLMAQRWDNGNAEVVIADHGIGIFEALRQAHEVTGQEEAIERSLLPGISSGLHRATGSDWDNTGFGLYVVSQLGKQFGTFSLLSSERLYSPNDPGYHLSKVGLGGTIVKLKVATRDAEYWPNILANIVERGEQEARLIPGAVISASKGSKKSNVW